jgi:TolA-binding protein
VSVVDLHPENLLDKEIRGELDAAERQRLEAHLEQCATCRLERRMRADFALELERDSVPPDVAALVESLARRPASTGEAPPADVESPVARPARLAPERGPRRKIVLLMAAAALTLVAGAFASTQAGRRALAPFFGRNDSSTPLVDAPATGAASHLAVRASAVRPAEALPSSDAPVPAEPLRTVAVLPPPAPSPVAPPVAAPVETPATLFEAESEARRNGDGARVLQLHAQLVARYPQSREAQVSRMMVARLLLDRGDAAGALAGFDAYLRAGSGELREDALAGRATALDRLGRADEARGAWMALLDQYPGTAYAAHARARIEASGGN